jgi:hypothetical protein
LKKVYLYFIICLGFSGPCFAQIPEYDRKAAIIAAFTSHVKWPPDILREDLPLVVGILGTDPFGDILINQLKKKYSNRVISVNYSTTVSRLQGSHIIYISNSERNDIVRIIKEIDSYRQAVVLTIGDEIPNFCENGGIINFINDGNGFDINLLKATKVSLVIEKSLIRAARSIINIE